MSSSVAARAGGIVTTIVCVDPMARVAQVRLRTGETPTFRGPTYDALVLAIGDAALAPLVGRGISCWFDAADGTVERCVIDAD